MHEPPDTGPEIPPAISEARRAKVETARHAWIKALIDKTRRNNLLYFRELKTGTLELTSADRRAIERLLKGEEVSLSKLLPKGRDLRAAEAAVAEIRRRAMINREERGLETLFVTLGFATWASPDGDRPPEAPVLLVPIEVQARARGAKGTELRRSGDIQVNLVLLHVFESELGIKVEAEDVIAALQGDDEGEDYDPEPVYELLRRAAHELRGFEIRDRLILGNFAFQKTAMVKDLRENAESLAEHDLIAALSGDHDAQRSLESRRVPVNPSELDQASPDEEFLFLSADSSQQLVVRHALALQDGTIQGPPGTGKSQTIANLIAEFTARGKRVLFVAEKRAALDVVRERLRSRDLEHLTLDLHGAEISKRQVLTSLQTSRELIRLVPPVDVEKQHSQLINRRRRLIEHVNRLHSTCAPTGRSIYEVQGALLRLDAQVATRTRWSAKTLGLLTPAAIASATDALTELQDFRELFLRISPSPWNGARLDGGDTVKRVTALASELATAWPEWRARMLALCAGAQLEAPVSIERVLEMLAMLRDMQPTFSRYRSELFVRPELKSLVSLLTPLKRSAFVRSWTFLTSRAFREAWREARGYRLETQVTPQELYDELANALAQKHRWVAFSRNQSSPSPMPTFVKLHGDWSAIGAKLADLTRVLRRSDVARLPLLDLSDLLTRLAADRLTPAKLPRLQELEGQLATVGIEELAEELRRDRSSAETFVPRLQHAWYSSALDQAMEANPTLAGFQGRSHDRVVSEFRRLDEERIELAAIRVRRAHAEHAVSTMNQYPAETALVKNECQKKRSRMTVRRLLMEAPHVVTALRPCWMASPLSVSHLLPVSRGLFDIVLFDEASQVLPQDAVSALLRAGHAIVAGDRHQLPPTTFFLSDEALDEEFDEATPMTGFESILDQMSGLFDPWTLDWHYRSRDESLIAFSNRHIYSDRLVTFPGPGKHHAVQHHLVQQRFVDGQEDSTSEEVEKVVELVLDHAKSRPAESLGVITLGIKHQRRIEAALEELRRERPELDIFFSEARRERFFVKNLERVQGDERDAIILSVGYGKDRTGRLPYRFGPLLSEGGERRMNVAVTRARNRMAVVSAFGHADMDPKRSSARGVEFLRLYLQFAQSGGANLGDHQDPEIPLNDFEQAIHDALAAQGVRLLKQWGASRYRIDLVAQHPERPGRHVLAIECDGATYHSAQSARDRDRLRQQHLEALGWRFHRIWSTDWFQNRADELSRAMKAYREAVASADREDARSEDPPAAEPVPRGSTLVRVPQRAMKPRIPDRDSIEDYSSAELARVVNWVMSDGLLRTDEELLQLCVDELGFEKKGSRIVERIRTAIDEHRTSGD